MNDYKKYLPSKTFTTRILFVLVCIILFFTVKGIVKFFKNREIKKNAPTQMTVGTLIQKDSNDNGIPDWEEYLWGLDPYKNGDENKELINAKKNTLVKNNDSQTPGDTSVISENEALSREFFASIMSLQQTGNLNTDSINSISEAVGSKIEASPISDVYTIDKLKTVRDGEDSNLEYFKKLSSLINKYENEDIGKELTIISQALGSNDPQALYTVTTIATAYRLFSEELINLPVPNSIAPLQLSLANNYYKTGISLDGLSKTLADPITGMRALINYKKYSDNLVLDLDKISEALQ